VPKVPAYDRIGTANGGGGDMARVIRPFLTYDSRRQIRIPQLQDLSIDRDNLKEWQHSLEQ
jgi:hypothetical protein